MQLHNFHLAKHPFGKLRASSERSEAQSKDRTYYPSRPALAAEIIGRRFTRIYADKEKNQRAKRPRSHLPLRAVQGSAS